MAGQQVPVANEVVWSPDPAGLSGTQLAQFLVWAGEKHGRTFADYGSLHAWSVACPAEFWGSLASFCELQFRQPPATILEDAARMPGARWFGGATLNFAENQLRFQDDQPALICRDEAGGRRSTSYAQLAESVARAATGLRRLGVVPGDRVAGLVTNGPEAVIAMLATTSLGAVWSSCSPDFGLAAVLDRFGQIRPRVLIAADSYRYGGRHFELQAVITGLAAQLPGLAAIVRVPGPVPLPSQTTELPAGISGLSWDALLAEVAPLVFHAAPFDHPVYILYSSGTTGPPKGIVHGAGGTLLQHLKEHRLHTDLKRDDCLYFFTTCGWMMWNWLVSGLASGASLVLYDGSPTWPDPEALWRMAGEEGVTIFGTSPRFLAGLPRATEPATHTLRHRVGLTRLRTVLSTGAPLPPERFDDVAAALGPVQLCSISGGTDIVSCFALGNPLLPVRRGELQCAGLGMAVDVVDDTGCSLPVGQRGELVCRGPFPSQPVGFWDDPDGSRYRRAYFDRMPGLWTHGDYAERTAAGGFVIHGRSDAVLNPGGVRIGTAELYRAAAAVPEVHECLAAGQRWQGDERVVLFVVLATGVALDAELTERIRQTIRRQLSPRHVPAKVLQVPDLPRTRNGKLAELAVRAVVRGEVPGNEAALENPGVLVHFAERPELRS